MVIDLACPVENNGIQINNGENNEQYLLFQLKNISDWVITEVSFHVDAYDGNGNRLSTTTGVFSELYAEPMSVFAENKAIAVEVDENARHYLFIADEVKFENGEVYQFSPENTIEVEEPNVSLEDGLLLREFCPQAVCFAMKNDNYWRCVCGRVNLPHKETCVHCGMEKETALVHLSSREAALDYKEEKEKQAQQFAEQQAAQAAQMAEQKRVKRKKMLGIGAIGVAAVLLVGAAGFGTVRLVKNKKASSAIENGNYLEAYQLTKGQKNADLDLLYAKIQGNTPENLMYQSGIMTQDGEFLYYLDLNMETQGFDLIKANKNSGEKTRLTDAAGGSLNVTKDWIYFVSMEDGTVKRISKDGKTIENVLDVPVSYLAVMEDTLYYLRTDYDNPNNLSEEQCETLVAQGQMTSAVHLYTYDVQSKKSTKLSDADMMSCAIYGDEIYYLNNAKDTASAKHLYVMDINGKNVKTVIDEPVESFLKLDNKIYYIKVYTDADIQANATDTTTNLHYMLCEYNTDEQTVRELAQDYLVTYINRYENKLFFIGINRAEYTNYVAEATAGNIPETPPATSLISIDLDTLATNQIVTGNVNIFNMADDNILMYIPQNGMCRVKADGTGFEVISDLNTAEENTEPVG